MTSIDAIGSTAGTVWRFLKGSGPATLSAIEKGVDVPKSQVAMAVGWLAREGKIAVEQEGRTVRYVVAE